MGKVEVKEEIAAATMSRAERIRKARQEVSLDIDSIDDDDDVLQSGSEDIDIDSKSDSSLAEMDVDIDSIEGHLSEEEIGSSDEIEEEDIICSDGEASASSEVEDSIFIVPSAGKSLTQLQHCFVERCLATLYKQRGPMWARPKIDPFFQDIFYKRAILLPQQQTSVEGWQARIKSLQKNGARDVGMENANACPLQSHRPVIDSRETRNITDADSNAWAAKQTFDSRESCGGSGVLR